MDYEVTVTDVVARPTAVHRGPFGEIGSAHDRVFAWCATHGRRPTGTRWEVYGPHNDDPAEQWTEVYWLLG